jgi:hypothetical protein
MSQELPAEILEAQERLHTLLSELTALYGVYFGDDPLDYDPEDYPKEDAMMVLTGWIVAVQWTDVESRENWYTFLGNRDSTPAFRIGLAQMAADDFS